VAVLGGGVIGLSIARELAVSGLRVAVLDQGPIGQEASWAGAGILPPANRATAEHSYDQLRGLSMELHPRWAAELREETGIDTGFARCGGLYLARSPGEAAALRGMSFAWEDEGIEVEQWDADRLASAEPKLAEFLPEIRYCCWLPGEWQLRNPWHLRALAESCRRRGVELLPGHAVQDWAWIDDRLDRVITNVGEVTADQFCVCAGAWTQQILARLRLARTTILPIRGQMLLYRLENSWFHCVLNEGSRYVVPRADGHLLVGSTEEEAGFQKLTTEEGLADLRRFASGLLPPLADKSPVQSWAGLRPGTLDGLPYLGRIGGTRNGYVAAGHYRSGLYLSPATAVVMRQLMLQQPLDVDLAPFSLLRHGQTPVSAALQG
jgi:glycine oxidase